MGRKGKWASVGSGIQQLSRNSGRVVSVRVGSVIL